MISEEIVIAGFGGQGVLSMGKILAYAGIFQGLEASWFPSYGPEMRGGTANVTVIMSEEKISSPIANFFDSAVLLSQQALDKFEPLVKPGGLLLYEANGISTPPQRKDINIYKTSAAEEAIKLSSLKSFNMVVLGAFLQIQPIVELDNIIEALKRSLPQRHHHLIPVNEEAIRRGHNIVDKINGV